jgi:hypothetical protein
MFKADRVGKYKVEINHQLGTSIEDVESILEIEYIGVEGVEGIEGICVFDAKLAFFVDVCKKQVLRRVRNARFEYSRTTDSMRWLGAGLGSATADDEYDVVIPLQSILL